MPIPNQIVPSLRKGIVYTLMLSIVFVLFAMPANPPKEVITALPFFIVLYFMFFTIDRNQVSNWLRKWVSGNFNRILIFPLLATILFFIYLAIHGSNPLKGTVFLVPYLLFFPILAFAARKEQSEIGWFDFTIFFLYFFPVTLVEINPSGDLPFNGSGFDSVYRILIMLSAVFAFSVVRNLKNIGAFPVFRWKFLFLTIIVWLGFYLFVFIISYPVHFIRLAENNIWNLERIEKIFRKIISVFLHTALFEELVFRGILQNLLGKRIAQNSSWKKAWWQGAVILILLSLVTGYAMKGGTNWFPALITIFLFSIAYYFETKQWQNTGSYTALAITSVIFGLVHFHSGSIIFTGLAAIGGWAYGYVYLKTKNTFYAALLHALVNSSPLIFGIELVK